MRAGCFDITQGGTVGGVKKVDSGARRASAAVRRILIPIRIIIAILFQWLSLLYVSNRRTRVYCTIYQRYDTYYLCNGRSFDLSYKTAGWGVRFDTDLAWVHAQTSFTPVDEVSSGNVRKTEKQCRWRYPPCTYTSYITSTSSNAGRGTGKRDGGGDLHDAFDWGHGRVDGRQGPVKP